MAENSSSTPWVAFIAGIALVAIIAVGYFSYTNSQPQHQASLEVNLPSLPAAELPRVDPPRLPAPPTASDPTPAPASN